MGLMHHKYTTTTSPSVKKHFWFEMLFYFYRQFDQISKMKSELDQMSTKADSTLENYLKTKGRTIPCFESITFFINSLFFQPGSALR